MNAERLRIFAPLHVVVEEYVKDLTAPLQEAYDRQMLGILMNSADILKYYPCERENFSQLLVIPAREHYFDFDDPIRGDEKVYLHIILLIAVALNDRFHQVVREIVENSDCSGRSFPCPLKSYTHALSQMTRSRNEGFRTKPVPRSAFHTDACRHVVVAPNATSLMTLAQAITSTFGGARVTNQFTLDSDERATRYHILSLSLTLPFTPQIDWHGRMHIRRFVLVSIGKRSYGMLYGSEC